MTAKFYQLHQVPLFKDLSAEDFNILKSLLRENTFEKGEMIFWEGRSCERIFIVQSGRVKIFRTSSTGKEQITEILGQGDSCACNPGSAAWCCSASAQALTSCKVWLLPRSQFSLLINSNHRLMSSLAKLLAGRLCRFNSLIEEISLDNPQRKLIKFILDMQSESQDGGPGISFTHEEISHRLGLVRETVTRHLLRLKRLKFIDIRPRQITIRNREGLKKLIDTHSN